MKKLFALFLALALLFLTACNTATPPAGTSSSSESSGENPSETDLTDQIIVASSPNLIELTSRIIFETNSLTYYYSKADEKAYVYCFDPLCEHTDYMCLANPAVPGALWDISSTVFTGDRFYSVTGTGQIISFAFDGSDKRIEYDAKYDLANVNTNLWGGAEAYGQYVYFTSRADDIYHPHLLRFNIDTKTVEDLTEQTGTYIVANYFYNEKIYGHGNSFETGQTRFVADLDLKSVEIDENPIYILDAVGSIAVGKAYEEVDGKAKVIGIEIYNFKTGDRRTILFEALGLDGNCAIGAVTEEYIYFYQSELLDIGTITVNRGGEEVEAKVQKKNNGKLYRIDLDGTNLMCVYDNPDYELSSDMIIYGDCVVMRGQYLCVEAGKKKIWGGAIQVATINPDGTIGEFVEVEVLQ